MKRQKAVRLSGMKVHDGCPNISGSKLPKHPACGQSQPLISIHVHGCGESGPGMPTIWKRDERKYKTLIILLISSEGIKGIGKIMFSMLSAKLYSFNITKEV